MRTVHLDTGPELLGTAQCRTVGAVAKIVANTWKETVSHFTLNLFSVLAILINEFSDEVQ